MDVIIFLPKFFNIDFTKSQENMRSESGNEFLNYCRLPVICDVIGRFIK